MLKLGVIMIAKSDRKINFKRVLAFRLIYNIKDFCYMDTGSIGIHHFSFEIRFEFVVVIINNVQV